MSGVSIIAFLYASNADQFEVVAYLGEVASRLGPIVNLIGVTAILLSFLALILKDLEHVSPESWGRGTRASWWGGIIRRLAGDLTLWTYGGFISFFFCLLGATISEWVSDEITLNDVIVLLFAYPMMIFFISITGLLNVFVRKESPPLAHIKPFSLIMIKAWRVPFFYSISVCSVFFFLFSMRWLFG